MHGAKVARPENDECPLEVRPVAYTPARPVSIRFRGFWTIPGHMVGCPTRRYLYPTSTAEGGTHLLFSGYFTKTVRNLYRCWGFCCLNISPAHPPARTQKRLRNSSTYFAFIYKRRRKRIPSFIFACQQWNIVDVFFFCLSRENTMVSWCISNRQAAFVRGTTEPNEWKLCVAIKYRRFKLFVCSRNFTQ